MNSILDIVWLIPVLPLIGFLLNGLLRNKLSKQAVGIIGCGTILLSFILSLLVFFQVKNGNVLNAQYFDLIRLNYFRIGFDFKIDQLSALFLLIITGVGFLIHVYSTAYMHEEDNKDFAKYFSFLNFFVFSMLLLVMGGNFLILFFGWEGVGLCSYLLIGYWYKNREYTNAAKKAFIMNRIGDLAFLLALFWIILRVNSLDFDRVFSVTSLDLLSAGDLLGITLLLFVGATGKSAQIPLFTWLPDAMAGPTPVSALIHAATMVTAGIYMIARSNILYTLAPYTQEIIMIIGMATAFVAATIALQQNDIKKVLAYSTVSQLGFMFVALGVGAYTAAVFHVMTHAFFKALLFLGSGSVIHAMSGEQDMRSMGGLKKWMPTTHWTFLVGCIAIAGIPPLSGFFSKDEILASAFGRSPLLWGIGVLTAMLTAFYMFRLFSMTFTGKFRGTHEQEHHLHESPAAMTIPLIVLAVLSIVAGFIGIPEFMVHGGHRLAAFLQPVFEPSLKLQNPHTISHSTEYLIMGISVVTALASLFYALNKFKNYEHKGEPKGIWNVFKNKWYLDEFYNAIIVRPMYKVSAFFNNILENKGIDGFVNGVGRFILYSGRQLRWVQSGKVGLYILLMVIGMLILFTMQLFF